MVSTRTRELFRRVVLADLLHGAVAGEPGTGTHATSADDRQRTVTPAALRWSETTAR